MSKCKAKSKATNRDRVDLINFVIDATADVNLARRFLKCNSAKKIRKFFKTEGYDDIPLNDCKDILAASKKMHGHGISPTGVPVNTSAKKGY